MSASDILENGLLKLIFNGTSIVNIAQNIVSSPATVLYVSLHTSDPGEVGNQSTAEATYVSYARVAVNRDATGWTVTTNTVTNTVIVLFPTCTGGSNTITHFGIGTDISGTGTLLLSGPLTATLNVSNTIAPVFQIGQLSTTCD